MSEPVVTPELKQLLQFINGPIWDDDLISKSISKFKLLIKVFNMIVPRILNMGFLKRKSEISSAIFPLGYILVAEKQTE